MAAEPPIGTVTFLFAARRQLELLAGRDAAARHAAAAERHGAIVRDVIARHGGHVFSSGDDGFAAAFATAVDAAEAAVELQRQLLR